MTLQIDITQDQEARLAAEAEQQGVDLRELVHRLLTAHLAEATGENSSGERDPDHVARVRRIRGKYADLGVTADDLHLERQADKARESL